MSDARAYLCEATSMTLPINIRLGQNGLPRTNALVYSEHS